MTKKLAELRWWSLIVAVLMSGLAVDRFIQGHGANGVGEAILAAALWVGAVWGFVVQSGPDSPLPASADLCGPSAHRNWNPTIISTHGEGSFNRTMIIGGVGVAIGVALLALGVEVGLPIAIGSVVVPFATWRHNRRR